MPQINPHTYLIGELAPRKGIITFVALSSILVVIGVFTFVFNLMQPEPAPLWLFPLIFLGVPALMCAVCIPLLIKYHQYALFNLVDWTVSISGGEFRPIRDITHGRTIRSRQGRLLTLGYSSKEAFVVGTAGALWMSKGDIGFIKSIIHRTGLPLEKPAKNSATHSTQQEVAEWLTGMR